MGLLDRFRGLHLATATIDVYGHDMNIYLDVRYEKYASDLSLERLKMYLVPLIIERLLYRVEKELLTIVVGNLLGWMSTCEIYGFREARREKPNEAAPWATIKAEYRFKKHPLVLLYADFHPAMKTRPANLMAMLAFTFAVEQIPTLPEAEREVAFKMIQVAAPYWPENPPGATRESWDWDALKTKE